MSKKLDEPDFGRAGSAGARDGAGGAGARDGAGGAGGRDGDALNYLTVVLGFGLCRAWIVFCLSASFLHSPWMQSLPLADTVLADTLGLGHAPYWLYLVAGALAALFAAFVAGNFREDEQGVRVSMYRACGALLALSAVIIPFALAQHIELLILSGFVIGGAGAGVLQVLWGEQFAKHEIRFATIASPAAAIVTAVLVALTSAGISLVGYIVFPLLSFGLLVSGWTGDGVSMGTYNFDTFVRLRDRRERKKVSKLYVPIDTSIDTCPQELDDRVKRSFAIKVGKLMFSIMVFSFLCRIFDTLPQNGPDPFALFGGSVLFSLIIVGGSFLALSAVLGQRFNPTFTYRLSLPIMVAGFVAIVLFFDTHAAVCILLINIGYEFFDILVWILFTETARRAGESPLRIFGLGVAFMFTGMALGYLVGDVLNSHIAGGGVQVTAVAVLSILSLVVVAFLVIPEQTVE
ncbi:MAG: hypothetical protein LBB46_05830, partial [Coriobacteriaceae bacterium]|nr:hypothetical protein [Coriobacteriaceae bacterium]